MVRICLRSVTGNGPTEVSGNTGPHALVLNPGSSTLKFGLYQITDGAVWAEGIVDRLGTPQAELRLILPGERAPIKEGVVALTAGVGAEVVLRRLPSLTDAPPIDAIGCRVVHGGAQYTEATLVTEDLIEGIRALGPLAPLHNPAAADVLEACRREMPAVPTVAVFDTAFHATLPTVARTYALPRDLVEPEGLRRYGFHGIAHRAVSEALRSQLITLGLPASRCITCHLGSGASACAVRDGKSIDTSMGMTPLEGLVMGTRSGDIDPGILLHLLRTGGWTPEDLDNLLNHRSGLLGISGRSGDVRDLLQAEKEGDRHAHLALEVFVYRVAKTIGAYAVALEGLDAIAFSGGIGEHSPHLRQRICRPLHFLGVKIDEGRNNAPAPQDPASPLLLSVDNSPVSVWAIPADENHQIVRELADCLSRYS